MKRILLFLITNIAVLLVLGGVLRLLGVERLLDARGAGLDYWALLIFAGVFGMGGAFFSL
ncbi:MAG TPA: zinc metalloprotease HtpX, partial [Chromatiales bacterium]|nr:zinc metalloprotease HtpX [Chromatiales bacterium]